MNQELYKNLYVIFNPLIAFMGILVYPTILLTLLTEKYKYSLFLAGLESLCLYIINLDDKKTIYKYLQNLYFTTISNITNNITYLNKIQPTNHSEIILVIPHGAFCVAGTILIPTLLKDKMLNSPCVIFVDKILNDNSSIFRAVSRISGVYDSKGLTNDNVIEQFEKGIPSIAVMPGGFVEAVSVTSSNFRYYTNVYKYWIKKSIEYNYNIRILFTLNGAEFYPQPEFAIGLRTALAKLQIPTVIPSLPKVPKLYVNQWKYETQTLYSTLKIDERSENIYELLCSDIEKQFNEYKSNVFSNPPLISRL